MFLEGMIKVETVIELKLISIIQIEGQKLLFYRESNYNMVLSAYIALAIGHIYPAQLPAAGQHEHALAPALPTHPAPFESRFCDFPRLLIHECGQCGQCTGYIFSDSPNPFVFGHWEACGPSRYNIPLH